MEKLMKSIAETLRKNNISKFNMEYTFTSPFYIHTKIYDKELTDIEKLGSKIEDYFSEILTVFVYHPSELTGDVNDDGFIRMDLEVLLEDVIEPDDDLFIKITN